MPDTETNSRALKQSIVIDALRRGASIGEAAEAADISRRSVSLWAETDPSGFGALKAEAQRNKSRVVTEGQKKDWTAELTEAEAVLAKIDSELLEAAAPALAGNSKAQASMTRLREDQAHTIERIAALKTALQSADAHLERARAEEAEQARLAAEAEAGEHGKAQADAAAKIDRALQDLGIGWDEFVAASNARQSAARRSGRKARAAYSTNLVQAVFANALTAADAMGLDRRLRVRARPLSEIIK